MEVREDIQKWVEEGREHWAERAGDLRARFADVSREEAIVDALGMSLIGAGIGTIVMGVARRRTSRATYFLAGGFIVAGLAFIGGGAYGRRNVRISSAEENVREQLSSLDPIARAKVLKDMAGEQFAHLAKSTDAM